MADEMETCTVLVVGAGLSGVCAAKHLEEYGVDTIVLEASDRIGGRLHTVENEHVGWTDVGGAYAGPSQDRILKLIRELGLSTFKVYEEGDLMHYRKGNRTRFSGILLPPMHNPAAFLELNNALRELDRMVAEVPLDQPWKAPKAREWDSMTFAEWCRKSVWTKNARASVYQLSRINICAEPYEISLLFTLWYIGSAGGIARINSTEGGAQERKVLGGTQQIPKGVAKQLKGEVRLNEAVSRIEYGSEGCEVSTKSGRKYSAQYVILAIPPAMHSRIEFSPPVPSARTQLCQRTPMGSIIKTMTYYPRAYWREQGISGSAVVKDDDLSMPVDATMDDCKPDGSFPCIMGFVLGEKARVYSQLSKGERKRKIAQSYKKLFGIDEMANPIHFEEKDWNAEEWVGGAYTGFMGPGVMSQMGDVLREPIGERLFLAGTETATRWAGYMDGAVLAGRRAAREVLARLRHIRHDEIGADEVAEEMPVPDLTDTAWLRYVPSAQGVVKSTVLGGVLSVLVFITLRREDGILSTPVNWINNVIKKF